MHLLTPRITRKIGQLLALAAALSCAAIPLSVHAAEAPAPALSAPELAARLSAVEEGTSYVRLRMEIKKPSASSKIVFQIQIKERRSKAAADIVYQALWPKERKGEGVLLRKAANRPSTGSLFAPPDTVRPLDASQMKDALFGSDLCYADLIENFFAWEHQTLTGTEAVDGVTCQILESKPGKGDQSPYGRVRSWIDPVRLVPLRVEKYLASGPLARRITTTRVTKEDKNRWIPASLTVQRPGEDSVTEIEGSSNRLGVAYSDKDFTPDALKEISSPRAGGE